METLTIRATRGQVETLKESLLWDDIVKELELWKSGFDNELKSIVDNAAESNPSTASVLLHMGDLNGRIKAVDYMLTILDVFLDVLETTKEEDNVQDEGS